MNKSMKKVVCGALASVMLLGTATMVKAATPFTDVSGDSWYASYVDYAYNNKLMAGTSDTTFAPNQIMTRGMLVTVLHSIAEKPSHSGNNPFSDVGDSWYTNAVLWCYENGIVAGTSETTFDPDSSITREQMVAIMFKFAAVNKLDTSSRADLSGYVDAENISSYAKDAFSWAVAKGVISGTDDKTLSPQDGATRAECAVVLQRYHELLNTKPEPEKPDPQPPVPPVTEPEKPNPQPTEPENPEPPVHSHEWVHTHHDAVGHYETKLVCTKCGWYVTESIANAMGMDVYKYWFLNHQDPMAQKGEQHGYDGEKDFHVDVPAYDEWKCATCGEVVYSDPNA